MLTLLAVTRFENVPRDTWNANRNVPSAKYYSFASDTLYVRYVKLHFNGDGTFPFVRLDVISRTGDEIRRGGTASVRNFDWQ